jgi:hypothetical protein
MGAAEPACLQVMKTKKDFLFPNVDNSHTILWYAYGYYGSFLTVI